MAILTSQSVNFSMLRELVLCSSLQVLFVDVKLRLVNDVGILWQSIVNSLDGGFTVGLLSRPDCRSLSVNQYDVIPS